MIAKLFLAAALIGSTADPTPEPDKSEAWAEFSRFPARGASQVTISIGTLKRAPDGSTIYWARRSGMVEGGSTDSSQCPALAPIVESVRNLPLPALAPAGDKIIIGDGTIYSFTSKASHYPPNYATNLDSITITTHAGPLADWIDQALDRLKGCWSSS